MPALIVVDSETGGLDPRTSCMIEIAAQVVVVEHGKIDTYGAMFFERIKPDLPVSPQAAAVNGYTPETWDGEEPRVVLEAFRFWLECVAKEFALPMWTGCNPVFDVKFFSSDRRRHKVADPDGLSYRLIDIQSMAMPLIYSGEIDSVKLSSLRTWAGLTGEQTHSAVDDVLDTCEVLGALLGRFKR